MSSHHLLKALAASAILAVQLHNPGNPAGAAGTVDTVVRTITTTAKPTEVKVSIDGKTLFVSFYSDAKIEAIDIATGVLKWSQPVGVEPLPLEVSPDGLWVYSMSKGTSGSTLSRLSAATGVIDATVPLSRSQPWDSEMNSDGTALYIANSLGGSITRIDLLKAFTGATDYEIVVENLLVTVDDVSLSSNEGLIYASSTFRSAIVGIFNAEDMSYAGRIDEPKEFCTGNNKLEASLDGKHLYGTCAPSDSAAGRLFRITLADNSISVFDLEALGGDLIMTPDGSKIYAAHGGADFLTVLDVATGTLSKVNGVPNAAFGLALNPAGSRLFAATWGGDADNKFVKEVDTGVILNAQLTDSTQTCASVFQQGTATQLSGITSTTTVRKGATIYKTFSPSTLLYWARVTVPASTTTNIVTQAVNPLNTKLQGTRGSILYDLNCAVVKGARFTYGTDGSASVSVAIPGTYFAAVKFTASKLIGTAKLNRQFTFNSTVGPWQSPKLQLN